MVVCLAIDGAAKEAWVESHNLLANRRSTSDKYTGSWDMALHTVFAA